MASTVIQAEIIDCGNEDAKHLNFIRIDNNYSKEDVAEKRLEISNFYSSSRGIRIFQSEEELRSYVPQFFYNQIIQQVDFESQYVLNYSITGGDLERCKVDIGEKDNHINIHVYKEKPVCNKVTGENCAWLDFGMYYLDFYTISNMNEYSLQIDFDPAPVLD